MIILTSTQANRVRGLTTEGHGLAPVPLANGTFALPESVLDDPAHARYRNILDRLPKVPDNSLRVGTPQDPNNPSSPLINSDYEQDPVRRRRFDYSRDKWRPGEVVVVDDA
jgi:hypothetical protein